MCLITTPKFPNATTKESSDKGHPKTERKRQELELCTTRVTSPRTVAKRLVVVSELTNWNPKTQEGCSNRARVDIRKLFVQKLLTMGRRQTRVWYYWRQNQKNQNKTQTQQQEQITTKKAFWEKNKRLEIDFPGNEIRCLGLQRIWKTTTQQRTTPHRRVASSDEGGRF
jgi:hypothetical protein